MRTLGLLALLGATLALTGCGIFQQRSSWDPFAARSERQLLIRVQNRSALDVRVNVVAGGRREALGQVEGRRQAQYSVSWQRTQNVQFQVEPLAGRRLTIPGGVVGPGDQLDLYLEEPLSRSFVAR